MELNIRQQKFIDEYIISGNATQSYINAGYSEKMANTNASKLLQNTTIAKAIKERTEQLFDDKAMSVKEAIAISSSIARGEVQPGYSKQYDKVKGEVIKEVEYLHTPALEERQRSLEHILRINGAFTDRQEIDVIGAVSFIDDIS